jgi:two-component system response regulator FixJ
VTADGLVIVIDDHAAVRDSLRALLESSGLLVRDYPTAVAFLADRLPPRGACLLVDVNMPGMSGLELQEELVRRNLRLPLIVMTGQADVALAVRAMKAGALDFLEKPFDEQMLLDSVRKGLAEALRTGANAAEAQEAAAMIALLTAREREVMHRLMLGESNKLAAHSLAISPRTVEIHRAHIYEKLKARGLSDLVRLARLAGQFS